MNLTRRKIHFVLTRPARSNGGDRYETAIAGEPKPWVIYVPQSLSRVDGKPYKALEIELTSAEV